MPGPSLEFVCRTLLQDVRELCREKIAVPNDDQGRPRSVLVAMHTSIDFRQGTTESHPDDPSLLTFPNVLLVGPKLIEDLERRQPVGFNVYRNPDRVNGTIVREPYPKFYDLSFTVRVEAELEHGPAGLLSLIQALTAWAQESPRVAGLITEWISNFQPDENLGNEGDILRSTCQLRLRDWRSYGGKPETIKTVRTAEVDIWSGDAPTIAWAAEDSLVSDALRAAFTPAGAPGPFAVGDQGAAIFRGSDGAWALDTPTGVIEALLGLWGTSPTDLYAVGQAGTILHREGGTPAWVAQSSGTSEDLRAVFGCPGGGPLLAAGAAGTLLAHVGGLWQAVPLYGLGGVPGPLTTGLDAIWGADPAHLWVVGEEGVILRYQPSSSSWVLEPSGTTADLLAIVGDANGLVYAVGEDGAILVSTGDGTWEPSDLDGSGQENTLGAAWSDGDGVFFAGDFGVVLVRTPDRWYADPTGNPLSLYALVGSGPEDLFAVGEDGQVIHRSSQPGSAIPELIDRITSP